MTGDVEENNNTSLESNHHQGVSLRLGSMTLQIAHHQIPYLLMVAASIVLLIEAIGKFKNEGYAISVAVIAMVVALSVLAMTYKMEDKWKSVGKYIAYFLLLWNTTGAFILTFDGPFTVTQNGYFASWALSMFAFMATGFSFGNLQDKVKNSSVLAYLLAASIVTMTACIFAGLGSWESLLSFIIAIFTTALCGALIYMDQKGTGGGKALRVPCLAIFSCLWVFVVATLTFGNGTFNVTTNGYFGAWLGLFFCVYALCSS